MDQNHGCLLLLRNLELDEVVHIEITYPSPPYSTERFGKNWLFYRHRSVLSTRVLVAT